MEEGWRVYTEHERDSECMEGQGGLPQHAPPHPPSSLPLCASSLHPFSSLYTPYSLYPETFCRVEGVACKDQCRVRRNRKGRTRYNESLMPWSTITKTARLLKQHCIFLSDVCYHVCSCSVCLAHGPITYSLLFFYCIL